MSLFGFIDSSVFIGWCHKEILTVLWDGGGCKGINFACRDWKVSWRKWVWNEALKNEKDFCSLGREQCFEQRERHEFFAPDSTTAVHKWPPFYSISTKWPLIIRAMRITTNFYGVSPVGQVLCWNQASLPNIHLVTSYVKANLPHGSFQNVLASFSCSLLWTSLHFKDCSIGLCSLLLRLKNGKRGRPRDKRNIYP